MTLAMVSVDSGNDNGRIYGACLITMLLKLVLTVWDGTLLKWSRSCLSNKWLGQGPLGGVRCSAHRLGRWEEWQRVDDGGSSPSPTRSLFPIFCTCLKKNEKPASLT